jgi:glycosyltransferase involved in cell wall biosynthesis
MPSLAIISPCYNEASRLQAMSFMEFGALHADVQFFFVNDGSTDATSTILLQIQDSLPGTRIISLEKNKGKGEAIRSGIQAALEAGCHLIGYLDADLSTTLDEFYRLQKLALEKELDVLIGSRIKKMDTHIERSFFRHIVGRTLATIVDMKFKLGVYDTQCGAKIFKPVVIEKLISRPFETKWFFDVEILVRMRKNGEHYRMGEIPLSSWRNVSDSRLGVLSFPAVMKDLFVLLTKY